MKRLCYILTLLVAHTLHAQTLEYDLYTTSINSKFAELGVSFFKDDRVIFASSQKNDSDKAFASDRRRTNKQLFLELYTGEISESGDILGIQLFTDETNNRYFESDITFTPDFKTVFFTWNNFFNTRTRKDSAKWRSLHLIKAKFAENNRIMQIEPVPFNSPEYSVRNPELSADGKVLFFSSDMPGGHGGYDLYMVEILKNGYGEPQNLGKEINTRKDEMFPFPDMHGNLYFASDGHRGKGGFDIYKSTKTADGFEIAEALPTPINSTYDDFGFVLNSAESAGYITSNRKGSLGDVDIYRFDVRAVQPVCTQRIKLEIVEAVTEMKLVNAQVVIYRDEELLEEKHLHGGNTIAIALDCDAMYRFVVKKSFFDAGEFTLRTDQTFDTLHEKIIPLQKTVCTRAMNGQIVHAETNEALMNVNIQVSTMDGQLIESLEASNLFTLNRKLNCNTPYRLIASKEGFKDKVITLNITEESGDDYNHRIPLEPEIHSLTVNGERRIITEPIHFELNEFEITEEAVEELDKLVTFLKENPTLRIAVRNHTDSRAPDAYNLTLSNNRAQTIVDYLRSKGIEGHRVSGKGYGETVLLNHCTNGVDCSVAEHEINKRTEFVIISNQ